jgi:MFS family permease
MSDRTADSIDRYPPRAIAWYCLTLLLLCYFMYFADRNVLSLIIAPVRQDLNASNAQIGILQGYAFSVLNGVMALPFGWCADRTSRRATLVVGLVLWGCSTVASGFATTFTQLLVTRMGLGIGEAALAPAVFSLIADYFPKRVRGLAVGIYGVGGFAGIGASYLIGGMVLRALKGVSTVILPIVGETSVWHAAFIIVGAITLLLATIVLLTLREPPRLDAKLAHSDDDGAFFPYLLQHRAAFALVIAAYVCLITLAIAWFAWLPAYFIHVFKLPPAEVGLRLGWVTLIAGVLGSAIGGRIADWLTQNQIKGGKLSTILVMFVLAIPCAIGILTSESASLSLVWAFLFTFADGIGFSQYGAVMPEMFPSHMRGRSIAAWNLCSSALSYGLGPLLVGLSVDYLFPGETGLRYALAFVSIPVTIIGITCLWFARKPYDQARLAADPAAPVNMNWLSETRVTEA